MPPHEPDPSEHYKRRSRKHLLREIEALQAEVERLNEIILAYEQAEVQDPSAPKQIYPGAVTTEKSKRLAELHLRRYFEFMNVVHDSMRDGLYGVDFNGNIDTINKAAQALLGCSHGQVLGKPAHGLLHGKNADGSEIPVEDCPLCSVYINGTSAQSDEALFNRRDKGTVLVSYLSLPIMNSDGVIGAVVAFHDITQRKQLEEERRQSEHDAVARANQLEANMMAVADAMLVYDREGRVRQANPAACALFGLDASNMPTELKARFPRYHTLDANGQPLELEQTPLGRILAGEILTNEDSVDIYTQWTDGTLIRVNISGAPVRNSAGELDGAVCIARDVTHRRRREERVRDGLHAVLQLLESLLDGGELPDASAGPAVPSIGKRLVDLTRSLLDCRMVGVSALTPSSDNAARPEQLRPLAVAGLSEKHEAEWWDQVNGATLGDYFQPNSIALLRAGTPVFIDITQQAPLPDGRSVFGLHKLLTSPLLVHGTLVGVIGLEYADADRTYSPADLEMLRMVSRIAALLITRYADARASRNENADH